MIEKALEELKSAGVRVSQASRTELPTARTTILSIFQSF